MNYYYSIDGSEVAGPHSLGELTSLFATGTLPKTSQVCSEQQQIWQPLSSVIDTISGRPTQAAVTAEVGTSLQSRSSLPNRTPVSRDTDTAGLMPLVKRYPECAEQIKWGFVGTTAFFLLGVLWPLITIKKHVGWWIFTLVDESNTVSLASGLIDLFSNGHLFLFCVIFTFSIVFPTLKLGVLLVLWYRGVAPADEARWLHRLAITGKWSMLDVLVVSLLVVILKLGDLVAVEVHLGVFFFALSVILSMLITARVVKLTSGVQTPGFLPGGGSQITRDRRDVFASTALFSKIVRPKSVIVQGDSNKVSQGGVAFSPATCAYLSLSLGILSWPFAIILVGFLFSLIAVVLGIIALRSVSTSGPRWAASIGIGASVFLWLLVVIAALSEPGH